MTKLLRRHPLWLASAGFVLVISAFFWYEDIRQTIATYAFSPGTVVDFEQSVLTDEVSLKPVIHFLSHKGEMVELILPDNNQGLVEGGTVEVMYPASDPFSGNIYNEYILWGGPTLILFTGMILLLAFFVLINQDVIVTAEKSEGLTDVKQETLVSSSAHALNTLFVNVEKNRGAAIDGQMPYCIFTQWRDPVTSEIHFFKSQDLWLDPSEYIIRKKVKVFIDKNDPNHYSVDLSFLPDEVFQENNRLSEENTSKAG